MKHLKKPLSLLLSLLLLCVGITGLTVTASAEETMNPSYSLKYAGEGAQPFLYGSPMVIGHNASYDGWPSSGYIHTCCVFNLKHGDTSIPAYCTDVDTSTRQDTDYRRINLEDCTYYPAGAAGKLRSILLNSFPYMSLEGITAAVAGTSYEVTELQSSEALTAAQLAIWKTTHGADYWVTDFYRYHDESNTDTDYAKCVYPDSMKEPESAYTESNITNLYNYYMSLEATAPMTRTVSEFSLQNVVSTREENADGTVTVTGFVEVNANIGAGDDLTLTATMGNETLTRKVTAPGKYQFRFTPVSQVSDIKFVISGTQTGGDVYFFDALGDRTVAQSMIGYDDSTLPVYGEVSTNPSDRVLNIYKKAADGVSPLQNISFQIYKVGTLTDWMNGQIPIGGRPTEEELARYAIPENLVTTITTDSDGVASYNFGQTDGVYLVTELPNAVIEKPVDPFYVSVPYLNGDDQWQYAVNVHPKNTVKQEEVDIEKDVTQIDNDHDTFDVGEVHTWIIQSTIPSGLATAQRYEISDQLDYRLTYQGNVIVTVSEKAAAAHEDMVTLEEGTDYTLTHTTVSDEEGRSVSRFVMALTAAGMEKVAAVSGMEPELRVYFDTIINENAQLGVQIPNQAHVDYTNNVGTDYDSDSDQPEVHTGGLKVHKVDASDITKNLAGATFRLARLAREGEQSVKLTVDGTELDVVYVTFYTDETMTGEKVDSVTTNQQGVGLLYGLAYGEYYLVETAAPEGYNRLMEPVKVTISANSHLDDDTATTDVVEGTSVTVKNSSEFQMPETGGMGTTLFTILGVSLMAVAAFLMVVPGKKKFN